MASPAGGKAGAAAGGAVGGTLGGMAGGTGGGMGVPAMVTASVAESAIAANSGVRECMARSIVERAVPAGDDGGEEGGGWRGICGARCALSTSCSSTLDMNGDGRGGFLFCAGGWRADTVRNWSSTATFPTTRRPAARRSPAPRPTRAADSATAACKSASRVGKLVARMLRCIVLRQRLHVRSPLLQLGVGLDLRERGTHHLLPPRRPQLRRRRPDERGRLGDAAFELGLMCV